MRRILIVLALAGVLGCVSNGDLNNTERDVFEQMAFGDAQVGMTKHDHVWLEVTLRADEEYEPGTDISIPRGFTQSDSPVDESGGRPVGTWVYLSDGEESRYNGCIVKVTEVAPNRTDFRVLVDCPD